MATIDGTMMCFSNVAHLPFPERVRAAQLAGCDQLSTMPIEVRKNEAAGYDIATMKAIAADHGITITRLDPLVRWTRIWEPDNMPDGYTATIDFSQDEFFAIADALGCSHASLNATFPKDSMPMAELVESYAAICRRAAEHGMTCDLEFIPLWGIRDLETAWAIVDGSGAPNGGIVFDTWHYVRGKPDPAVLRRVPGAAIHSVQLNDGPVELPPGVTIVDDCYKRLFPGEGNFPLVEVVQILAETGGLRQLGAEVFSPVLASMSTEEVAAKSRDTVAVVLEKAGIAAA